MSQEQDITNIGLNQFAESFIEAYQQSHQDIEANTEEGLGIALAHWAEWDGIKHMRVMVSALTDANFHTEADIIQQWIEKSPGEE